MFMLRQEGPPIVMDEIPRTYYPGRGFLTDQEAYPTDMYGNVKVPEIPKDIFNRAPRYGGGLGIPGAPGNSGVFNLPYNPANDFGGFMNLPYIPGSDMGGVQLLAGNPSFDLNYGRGRDGTSLEGIPNANDPVMRKKLRDRLLKNPAGTESLPGFLGKV